MQTATVTVFNGMRPFRISGKIVKECPLGLVIEDDRQLRHYALFERVERNAPEIHEPTTNGRLFN